MASQGAGIDGAGGGSANDLERIDKVRRAIGIENIQDARKDPHLVSRTCTAARQDQANGMAAGTHALR
ncbi:hypothetical protein D3C71_2181030 [compost metagenome]